MTGATDPPPTESSGDRQQGAPGGRPEPAYDDFLREVDRMAAERQAASRRAHDARRLGLVALAIVLAALGIALVTVFVTAPR
jgi:hypothetical protein